MPRCSQPNCRIADPGGVCLEGHKQGCPHLLPEGIDVLPAQDQQAQPATTQPPLPEPHRFHTGEKLTISEASKLLTERSVRVVLCAGSQWSGKTTFLARLGEMFRNGSFSRYRFVNSFTLSAFERASWWATFASGATRPDTPRTRHLENDTYLHLRINREDDPTCHSDVLISDLAGETFPTAVGSHEFCVNLRALGRADHLIVFLDCARLVNPTDRAPEFNNVQEFLQRVLMVRTLDAKSLHVQVIFSRWDYVSDHSEKIQKESFCEAKKTELIRRFDSSFASLEFRQIAARPEGGAAPTNAEIQSVFTHCLEIPLNSPAASSARNPKPIRDFSAFGLT